MTLYYCPSCDDCVEPATDDRGRDVLRVSRSGLRVRVLACDHAVRASNAPASASERLAALGLTGGDDDDS